MDAAPITLVDVFTHDFGVDRLAGVERWNEPKNDGRETEFVFITEQNSLLAEITPIKKRRSGWRKNTKRPVQPATQLPKFMSLFEVPPAVRVCVCVRCL